MTFALKFKNKQNMKKVIFLFIVFLSSFGYAQVTTSAISGVVKSDAGKPLVGASVEAKHLPTGTKYYDTTDNGGRFGIPAIRPGGPYKLTISYIGFKTAEITEILAPLGGNFNVNVLLDKEQNALQEVVVKAVSKKGAFNKGRTGASQQFNKREIAAIPVAGSRSINSVTKYNANAGANNTFGGQDSRLNNFTIDGSGFNNGFGLGNETQAGGRTGSTAISIDAIEQIQLNIAPFDVRLTGFTGSGINAVTKSGTNDFEGTAFMSTRNNRKDFIGTKSGEVRIVPATFDEKLYSASFGAPIIKDKLFIFGNFETLQNLSPATTWTSTNSPKASGQVSDPTFAQMQGLSDFLQTNFNYKTGPWENYDNKSASQKFLIKLDWNINDNNKFSARYLQHDSEADELTSNSNTLGFGNRRTSQFAMSYQNSGYKIQDNTKSAVLQLDSKLSSSMNNNLIVSYNYQNEDRGLIGGGLFPTIDILNGVQLPAPATGYSTGNQTLISAGLDPFTQGNKLDYSTFQVTNNVTKRINNHSLLFGANYERFVSNNSFIPGSNGVYVFNSLDQFYAAANESIASGGLPSVNNIPTRFQLRYSALPDGEEPLQILKSNKIDAYFQDDIKLSDRFKISLGIRSTYIAFDQTGRENTLIKDLTYAGGEKFNTATLPKPQMLFEPRVGFNLDLNGDNSTVIRGGSGIFTGKPPYVWISNSVGNNGVLTGFIDNNNTNGFTVNAPQAFTPANAQLPTTFDLAFSDPDYKFPQAWKTTIAVDQKFPFGFVGTLEGIYNKNINEGFVYNANLANPVGTLNVIGDNRPLFAGNNNGVRINNNIANGIVLTNSNQGYFYSTTFKLDYPYKNGVFGSVAYTISEAYDLMSPGSTATGSWTGIRSVNGNNDVNLSRSANITPNRIVGLLGYKVEYGEKTGVSTSFNIGYIGEEARPFTYSYGGDLNGDMVNGNDLMYVPLKGDVVRFTTINQNLGGSQQVIYTEAQQQVALEAFIDQDPYLSTMRGQYVERNASNIPILHRFDVNVTQDFFIRISGKKHTFQFRADILNAGNLLNRTWGVTQRFTVQNLLSVTQAPSLANNFTPFYNMALQTDNTGKRFLATDTYQKNASAFDVWQAQFSLRYTFGK